MPTAIKFEAEGMNNGFPYCLEEVEVSTYDYWSTLSGVTKDSPTTSGALIAESLVYALKLYWNAFELTGSASATGTRNVLVTNVDTTYKNLTYYDGVIDIEIINDYNEPRKRTCGSSNSLKVDIDLFFINRASMNIDMPEMCKMYNNGSFVGYGIKDTLGSCDGDVTPGGFLNSSSVSLGSFGDLQPDTLEFKFDKAYISLEGISFVSSAEGFSQDGPTPIVVNAADLLASSSATSGGNTDSTQANITGINFYTY